MFFPFLSTFSFFLLFLSLRKNLKGFSGKLEKERIDDNQNTKSTVKSQPHSRPIDLHLAVSRNIFSLLLRADVKYGMALCVAGYARGWGDGQLLWQSPVLHIYV